MYKYEESDDRMRLLSEEYVCERGAMIFIKYWPYLIFIYAYLLYYIFFSFL